MSDYHYLVSEEKFQMDFQSHPATQSQPAPVAGKEVVLTETMWMLEEYAPELMASFQIRADKTMSEYASPLMTCNGRNATVEWFQEAIDGVMYGMQKFMESSYKEECEEECKKNYDLVLKQIHIARLLHKDLVEQGLLPNG